MSVYCIINQTMRLSDPTRKVNLAEPLAYSNQRAHAFRVTVLAEGSDDPADLTGVGVTAAFMRVKSNDTVTPIIGTVTGNVAEVVLPASCYNVVGRFTLTVDLSMPTDPTGLDEFDATATYAIGDRVAYDGSSFVFKAVHTGAWDAADVYAEVECRTALWVDGIVEKNTTESIIDPGTPVANYTEVINSANAAASSAISAAANANAAATRADNAVSYSVQTGKSEEAKANARKNIGAVEPDFVNALHGLVDYNFSTPGTGSVGSANFTRTGILLAIAGSNETSTIPVRARLNGDFNVIGTSTVPSGWGTGLALTAGHTYRWTVRQVRGTATKPLLARVYAEGSFTDFGGTAADSERNSVYTFAYASTPVNLCMVYSRSGGGATFTDCVYECTLTDENSERDLPPAPTTAGTYTLKVTVANGIPSYAWVQDAQTSGGEAE